MTALLALALALQQTPAPAQQPPGAPPATTAPAPARRPPVAATSTLQIKVTDRKGLSAQGVKVVAEGAVGREGVSDAAGSVLFLAFGASGCASTDENMSERPWNAPRSWEHGIPQSIMQGR